MFIRRCSYLLIKQCHLRLVSVTRSLSGRFLTCFSDLISLKGEPGNAAISVSNLRARGRRERPKTTATFNLTAFFSLAGTFPSSLRRSGVAQSAPCILPPRSLERQRVRPRDEDEGTSTG